jgi:xanthine dehydrogenase small subunit
MAGTTFTLNDRVVTVEGSPTTTLLVWLRQQPGLTGTKEGCAEGDCGACTVVIHDAQGPDGPTWRAVNACLVFLPMLHGRTVYTVEGLARDGEHHAVQRAVVAELGSQCGYCTPGVVMSMFEACYRKDLAGPEADGRRDDQMCGNLCRCTGYRPIRDAVRRVAGCAPDDRFAAALGAVSPGPAPLSLTTADQRYLAPATLDALFERLAWDPDARVVCGGTDLALEVTKGRRTLTSLLSLEALPELRRVERIDGGVRYGATTLLSDLEAATSESSPPIARMLRFFASRQIKNRATLGGNLCNASPIGDLAPVLLALGATAIARSRSGERRIPLEEFFVAYRKTALLPGEILAAVEVPDVPAHARAAAYKVSKRRELDISAVCAGMLVTVAAGRVSEARLAYGGMAAIPTRARNAEAALVGGPWSEDAVEAACLAMEQDFAPIDDHRASAWYRATVAPNLLRGFFHETAVDRIPRLPARPAGTLRLETP